MAPHDLEDAPGDDETVEAVERGLEVDPRSQRPHAKQHFEDEKAEENKLGSVYKHNHHLDTPKS